MQVTSSEYKLIKEVINHLRSDPYANVTVNRRDNTSYIDTGKTRKCSVNYIGSVDITQEKANFFKVVLTKQAATRTIK